MCSVMAGLMGLSGYMQYNSQKQAADAQSAAYNAQAQAAEQNARIETRRQEQIADTYAQQQQALRDRRRLAEGQQRAAAGAAGLGMSGSMLDILSSGYDAYTNDQMNLLTNQRNDNYNSRIAETNWLHQASSARSAASNVRSAAKTQGMATILGTAASIYGLEQPWKNATVKKPANITGTGVSNYGNYGNFDIVSKNYTMGAPKYTIGTSKNIFGTYLN